MTEPRATEPRPLERLHDAYYAIPAGEPTVEQVMEALPALYDAVQGVLDGAARIGGLLAVVDSADRQGTTIHVATRATCRDHLADPNGYTSAHPARPAPRSGWSVEEREEEDGSWSIVSKALPGLVVAGATREEAWAMWPEVVELWASTANDARVRMERPAPQPLDVERLADRLLEGQQRQGGSVLLGDRSEARAYAVWLFGASDEEAAEYARLGSQEGSELNE